MKCLVCKKPVPDGIDPRVKYCGTNCRSKAYRDRQKEKDAKSRPAGHLGAPDQAAHSEKTQSGALPPNSAMVDSLQGEINRLKQELAHERSLTQELMRHSAALTEHNQDLLGALQRADGRFHWKEFLGGLATGALLQMDIAPKLLTDLLEGLVNPGARRAKASKQRQEQGSTTPAAQEDKTTKAEQPQSGGMQITTEPHPASASSGAEPPTDKERGSESPWESSASSRNAKPALGLTSRTVKADGASQRDERSRETEAASQTGSSGAPTGVEPLEQPGPGDLAIAILTLRRIQGQDVSVEDLATFEKGSLDLCHQELAKSLRLLGGHTVESREGASVLPNSARVVASQLLRGSVVVSKLFMEVGKQAPLLAFPAEIGELPAQLDEIYQRCQSVFGAKDTKRESGSRLRTLLVDLERWLSALRPVARQAVSANVLYAATYTARDALQQTLNVA